MATTITRPLLKKKKTERLHLNLSESGKKEVEQLADENETSITELVKLALNLLQIVIEERRKGNKLVIVSEAGVPQMQLVIPGFHKTVSSSA
jgi:hypothetical protein